MDRPKQEFTIYARDPIGHAGEIPIFSASDEYSENYDRIAGDHLAHLANTGENPFIKGDFWEELETTTENFLRRQLVPGARILDAGVGLGRLLDRFPGNERYGMDIAVSYLEVSNTKGIAVCLAKIEDMPYREEVFDAVVCTDVLEHVIDLNLCVTRLLAVLKPGGVLVLRVPYREDLSPYAAPDYPYRFAHLRTFDEHFLVLLFRNVFGVEVVEWAPAGYVRYIGRLKKYRTRIVRGMLRVFLASLEKLHPSAAKVLVERLYYPVEINVAIQKK